MWKDIVVDIGLRERIAAAYKARFAARTFKRDDFITWMLSNQVRPHERWTAAENKLVVGRLIVVRGVEEQTSVLIIYRPHSDEPAAVHFEFHGEDRGPNRRARVLKHLGFGGLKLL